MTTKRKIGLALGVGVVVILAVVLVGAAVGIGTGFGAPDVPHQLEGRSDCLSCHGEGGAKPYPSWHADDDYDDGRCADCHHLKTN